MARRSDAHHAWIDVHRSLPVVSRGPPAGAPSAGRGADARGAAYVDAEIGRLLDGLRARGLFDDSRVVVTSDHGEAFDEHGVIEHGVSLHQHQVHVPLIVNWPRRSPAAVAPVDADGYIERGAFEPHGHKLIADRFGRARLFDTVADRREQDDLLARRPAPAARLQQALARQFDASPSRPAATDTPSADLLERLRSLGYVK